MAGILKTFAVTLAAFTVIWLGGLGWFIRAIPSRTESPAGHYDAIIVLTGGKNRIPHALALLEENKAEALFISGVPDGFRFHDLSTVRDIPSTAVMAALRHRIHYGEQARDTIGNAQETLQWLRGKPYRSLLIVTANYHLPRTRLLFSYYLPDYTLTYAAVDPPQFNRAEWLRHANSRRLILLEYHKWLATWIKLHI